MRIFSVQANNFNKQLNFTAKIDESAYLAIRKANPDFKLPKGVEVVADDVFEKQPATKAPAAQAQVDDDYDPIYDDPNYHGYTEYSTLPTNPDLAARFR